MNRPFYAFGVLLALLALAMVAVSSSNRSTTVLAPAAKGEGSLLSPALAPGAIYIVVLPAGEDDEAGVGEPPNEVAAAICDAPEMSSLAPAVVLPAEFDATEPLQADEADCRSHYDSAYDELVYGQTSIAPATEWCSSRNEVRTDELLSLFRSLTGSDAAASKPVRLSPVGQWWRRLRIDARHWLTLQRPILLGSQNRALAVIDSLGGQQPGLEASPAITWSEYAAQMDQLASAKTALDSDSFASPSTVRSSSWLLDFAVSSLSQWGITLGGPVEAVEPAAGPACDEGLVGEVP